MGLILCQHEKGVVVVVQVVQSHKTQSYGAGRCLLLMKIVVLLEMC